MVQCQIFVRPCGVGPYYETTQATNPTSKLYVFKCHRYSLPLTKEEVNAFACICLSVCLSKITQKHVHGFG